MVQNGNLEFSDVSEKRATSAAAAVHVSITSGNYLGAWGSGEGGKERYERGQTLRLKRTSLDTFTFHGSAPPLSRETIRRIRIVDLGGQKRIRRGLHQFNQRGMW